MTLPELIGLAVKASIFLTVLGLGLSASWRDATSLLREPGLMARSMFAMFIAMPFVAGVFAAVFDLPATVQIALVALAIAPVPPILPKKELKAGGSAGYAVGLLVLSAIIAIVYVPLAVEVFDRIFSRSGYVAPITIAKIMFTSVLIPLGIGVALRHAFPAAAEKAASPVLTAGTLLLVLAALPLLVAAWPAIQALFGNGTVLIIAIVAVIGLVVGHVLGGPVEDDRTVLALSTSARHPAVALAVATSGGAEAKPELAAILLYVIVAVLAAVPYTFWRRKHGGAPGHARS